MMMMMMMVEYLISRSVIHLETCCQQRIREEQQTMSGNETENICV